MTQGNRHAAEVAAGEWPSLAELIALFYADPRQLGTFVRVQESEVPQPFRKLLAHSEHMTETVEAYHRSKVDVSVLQSRRDGEYYSRKIVLSRQSDGLPVQFGIPRLNVTCLSPVVRAEIEAEKTPLGRVLINHQVLREVQLVALWKVVPGEDLQKMFRISGPLVTYGRTALIYCDGEPAIELLEIVSPIE